MLKLKVISEDKVKPVPASEDDQEIDINIDAEVDTAEDNDIQNDTIPQNIIDKSFGDILNNLIQSLWTNISEANSVIASFDLDYSKDNKTDIIDIINTVVDDLTIDIGMLYKASEILNSHQTDLLADGKLKADKILDDDSDDIDIDIDDIVED